MAAGGPDKDTSGKTLRTHAEDTPRGWMSPTSGPGQPDVKYEKPLNRAERRALARKKK